MKTGGANVDTKRMITIYTSSLSFAKNETGDAFKVVYNYNKEVIFYHWMPLDICEEEVLMAE